MMPESLQADSVVTKARCGLISRSPMKSISTVDNGMDRATVPP